MYACSTPWLTGLGAAQQLIAQLQAINLGAETVDQTAQHHRYSNLILTRDHQVAACAINYWPTALGATAAYHTAASDQPGC